MHCALPGGRDEGAKRGWDSQSVKGPGVKRDGVSDAHDSGRVEQPGSAPMSFTKLCMLCALPGACDVKSGCWYCCWTQLTQSRQRPTGTAHQSDSEIRSCTYHNAENMASLIFDLISP